MFRVLKATCLISVCLTLSAMPLSFAQEKSGIILGGSQNSPIRIEVFSDFQCSHCRDLYLGTIRPLLQEYSSKDKVCVVYHEFPLSNHQYAREAAFYSEAAALLGPQKLLPVIDAIFSNQAEWSKDGKLEATVVKALNTEDFLKVKKSMREPNINAAVERGIQHGMKNEVTSTPTMIIYYLGKQQKAEGLIPYEAMKQFIDSIVK